MVSSVFLIYKSNPYKLLDLKSVNLFVERQSKPPPTCLMASCCSASTFYFGKEHTAALRPDACMTSSLFYEGQLAVDQQPKVPGKPCRQAAAFELSITSLVTASARGNSTTLSLTLLLLFISTPTDFFFNGNVQQLSPNSLLSSHQRLQWSFTWIFELKCWRSYLHAVGHDIRHVPERNQTGGHKSCSQLF